MMINIKSLQAKLLNIAKIEGLDYQLMINRYAGEQFLVRLSQSHYADKFIFKGGSLLAYIIDTDRRTKDLDFTIKEVGNDVTHITQIIKGVLNTDLNDGLIWGETIGSLLSHPDMDQPGVRVYCHFLLGKMRGKIQLDMALGLPIGTTAITLKRIRYKDLPLIGPDVTIYTYSKELVFAEKLQIAMYRRENNTRMRDYYDMYKLIHYDLDKTLFRNCFNETCVNRAFPIANELQFSDNEFTELQKYWSAFLNKSRHIEAPKDIKEIVSKVNEKLKFCLPQIDKL